MSKESLARRKNNKVKSTAGQEQFEQKVLGDNCIPLLHELVIYTKLANYGNIRNLLITILDSEDKKRVFEATDGNNSTRQIESVTGVNKDTVSNWWDEWDSVLQNNALPKAIGISLEIESTKTIAPSSPPVKI